MDPQPKPPVIASNLKLINKNTLVAAVDLEIPAWKIIFRRCLWLRNSSSEWVNFPAREWTDADGKKQFANLLDFTNHDVRSRFQKAALAAIHIIAPPLT